MDLMDLINNWQKIVGANKPLLPGQPSQATPPFAPPQQPTPAPAPRPPLAAASNVPPKFDFASAAFPKVNAAAALPEVQSRAGPKIGIDEILPEIQSQAGPKVDAEDELMLPKWQSENMNQPWYKDGNFMNELGGRLSNAFGSLTMRGNSPGAEKANMLKIAGAQSNRKQNKTFDALIKQNPELAKKMLSLSPESREKYMELAMRSSFGDIGTEAQGTANIRDFLFREGLDPEGQAAWDNMNEPGEKMVTTPNGAVIAVRPDGSSRMVLSSEQANQMAASGADAEKGGVAAGEEFRTMFKAARYAQDNIDGLYKTRQRLVNSKDEGGIFQPVKLFMSRVKEEFGSIEGAADATNEQLLEMEGVERTMQWFINSGLGARGLDTPAEFMQWLKLNGGDLTMTRDASIAFIDRAIDNTMRTADRYNDALTDPLYSDVDKIGKYPRSQYTDPRLQSQTEVAQPPPNLAEGATKTIGGVTYVYRNGQWFQQ